jgi:hypothetical protein
LTESAGSGIYRAGRETAAEFDRRPRVCDISIHTYLIIDILARNPYVGESPAAARARQKSVREKLRRTHVRHGVSTASRRRSPRSAGRRRYLDGEGLRFISQARQSPQTGRRPFGQRRNSGASCPVNCHPNPECHKRLDELVQSSIEWGSPGSRPLEVVDVSASFSEEVDGLGVLGVPPPARCQMHLRPPQPGLRSVTCGLATKNEPPLMAYMFSSASSPKGSTPRKMPEWHPAAPVCWGTRVLRPRH